MEIIKCVSGTSEEATAFRESRKKVNLQYVNTGSFFPNWLEKFNASANQEPDAIINQEPVTSVTQEPVASVTQEPVTSGNPWLQNCVIS